MAAPITLKPRDVRACKFCEAPIAWLTSKTGKPYAVNVDLALDGQPATYKTNFHYCQRPAKDKAAP